MRDRSDADRRRGVGFVALAVACGLLGTAVVFARAFHVAAVREFTLPWTTWAAALLLASAAGAIVAGAVTVHVRRWIAVLALAAAGVVLAHLPVVLVGGPAWRRWPGFATTGVVDRTAPQLLAAAILGAGVAVLFTRRRVAARRRGDRAGDGATG